MVSRIKHCPRRSDSKTFNQKIIINTVLPYLETMNPCALCSTSHLSVGLQSTNIPGSMDYNREAQLLHKCSSNFKILGAIRVTWSKVHTEDPPILCPHRAFKRRGDPAPGICEPFTYNIKSRNSRYYFKALRSLYFDDIKSSTLCHPR